MKKIKYEDIKTPKTVEEFRENLKKYFICNGNDWSNRNMLLVQGADIKIDELNCLSDLYRRFAMKPMIAPYVDFDMKSITDLEIMGNMLDRNFEVVLKDDSRFKIIDIDSKESHSEFMNEVEVMWYGIDNQILREFYIKTLGDFSGYEVIDNLEEVA
jgi:hypothetical protein